MVLLNEIIIYITAKVKINIFIVKMKPKGTFLPPIRISAEFIKELDELVAKFGYRSRSDIVREAIMDKINELKGMEIIQIRNISKEEAKTEILEYIKGKNKVYASDIADELRLDLSLTFEIIDELFREEKIEEVT